MHANLTDVVAKLRIDDLLKDAALSRVARSANDRAGLGRESSVSPRTKRSRALGGAETTGVGC